ncbi:Bcr/CflA family multidrug efflux MFS transporter [Vibrio sp. Of7-15]|uniref:purine nucleoside transporter PunC n=1 Tax=Vibrio sp. Of7-15 TaxID=2724879 RepID=UPI001EF26C7B|nr:purine nucleoside transporter PunC [Vibrio sp. Of7-15]MCG7497686.1 Bcr/CflA family multidrug efflux MFS transporter [Vibrio sp. Of7-15]
MKNNNQSIPYLWLAGLSMLGFLATDMYLPAFDIIKGDLGTSQNLISWTLSVFLLGMALGQLIYGPLSERHGKIKTLSAGMGLFSISSLVCAFAPNIETLLVARFFQALGACSATVIWQAVVIDRYDGKVSQRIFATIMPLVALSPALAPLVGAALEKHLGWSSIFLTLSAIGVLLILRSMTEKEAPKTEENNQNIIQQLTTNYRFILKSNSFKGNMLIFAACSAAFFAWLTGSPFIMTEMGYSGTDIGLSYVPQTIAFIVGGYGCRALLTKFEPQQLLPWLLKLFVVSVLVIFLVAWRTEPTSIIPLLIPFCFMAVANGAIYPIVVNSALTEFKSCSASAAGLLNFLQTMICFGASALVSALSQYGVFSMSTVMLVQGAVVFVGLVLVYKAKRNNEQLATNS